MGLTEEEKRKYLDILGLSPGASYVEIKRAYKRLKSMYSSDTSVLTPITIEFSRKKRQAIQDELDNAYIKISAQLEYEQSQEEQKKKTPERLELSDEINQKQIFFNGRMLRDIRRKLGIQLFDVALETKIRKEILQDISHQIMGELLDSSTLNLRRIGVRVGNLQESKGQKTLAEFF